MHKTFFFRFDKYILSLYVVSLTFYLFILFYFKSSFFVTDENRYFAQEIYQNYLEKGFWNYFLRKENESLPLIQRIAFITYYKIFGNINLRFIYLYSLIFLIGICHLFYIYFKKLKLSNYLFLPLFFSIFSLNHYVIFWCTANYFLPTFFFSLLLFHLIVQKPNSYVQIFLLVFLVPFGAANGMFAILIAIVYVTFIKNFKLLFGIILISFFHYILFFKLTTLSNSKPLSASILSILDTPIYFIYLFFAQVGAFSIISDGVDLKIFISAFIGLIFIVITIVFFVKNFILQKGDQTEKWLILTMLFFIISLLSISIRRHQGKSIIEILAVSWYLLFSYLLFNCIYLIVLKNLGKGFYIKIFGPIVISVVLIVYLIQVRAGIVNIYYFRNMGESNQFNFVHNNYVEENDKYRSSSNAIQKLIHKGIYTVKRSEEFDFLYQKTSFKHRDKQSLVATIKIEKDQGIYESDSLFKSDFLLVNVNNINKDIDFGKTFLLLEGKKNKEWIFYPYIYKKTIFPFFKTAFKGEFFHNFLTFNVHLSGIQKGKYSMSLISPTGIIPLSTTFEVISKYPSK
jgi:hypothetical protein